MTTQTLIDIMSQSSAQAREVSSDDRRNELKESRERANQKSMERTARYIRGQHREMASV